jgi:hypothetical protein
VIQVAGGHPSTSRGRRAASSQDQWEDGADGDNSVTQYALLGLHARRDSK